MTEELRTLLVGIDAGSLPVLESQFADGALPTLRDLFSGAAGELTSQIPPWTASAWPSLYTGTNPGKHGVFDFLTFDGYDWDVVNATHVRRRTIWELLDLHGYRSVVVNAPVTHPPAEFDGALVPGYMAPESPTCHPEGLLDEIEAEIGEYPLYGDVETATDCVHARGEAFRYLADRFDPDFGFLQFQWTDTVCHEKPGDWEALGEVYAAADEEIGETIDACDPRNVVVVSDHGMGPYHGREFRVNEFLKEHDLVAARRGGEGMPSWAGVRDDQLKEGEEGDRSDPGLAAALTATAAKFGLTSQRVGAALEKVGLDEAVLRLVPAEAVSAATEQVDFENSRAFMRSRTECGVRINLEGREPNGVVPQSEYESVRDELIEALSDVRTPEGTPVFETVAPRESFFEGPEAHRGVDVVTVPANFDEFLSARLRGGQFGDPTEPWNHKREGVIAASGADVDASAPLGDAHLFDVAPTVLATFDVPMDETMDGRPLPVVESAGEQSYPAYEAGVRSDASDDAVEARLSDLGYLE